MELKFSKLIYSKNIPLKETNDSLPQTKIFQSLYICNLIIIVTKTQFHYRNIQVIEIKIKFKTLL